MNANREKNIVLENISKKFGGVYALKGVDFDLAHEIHSIVGHNGAGKSTLVKILMGALQPDEGTITMNGKPVLFSSPREAQENHIAMVWQELANFPNLTITENLLMHRFKYNKLGQIDWKASHELAKAYLERIEINISPTTQLGKLSLAQQQLIEFAKAMSFDPNVLILDEPTSALSCSEQTILHKKIQMIKSQKVSVVFISHKLDEILSLSDRITVLRDGEKIFTKQVGELDKNQIVEAVIGSAKVTGKDKAGKASRLVKFERSAKPILQIKNLSMERKLNDVSIELYHGEVLGIVGVSGSGISEIGKILFGIERDYKGCVLLDDKVHISGSPKKAIKDGFGYVPKNRKEEGIIPQMTVGDNIVLSALEQISTWGFVRRKKRRAIIDRIMDTIDLKPKNPDIKIEMLSGGNQQKGVIARWLSNKPRVLILDEPTRGVDVGAIAKIYSLIRQMAAEGLSVIVISSEFEEIHDTVDRMVILNRGKVVGEMDPSEHGWEEAFSLSVK